MYLPCNIQRLFKAYSFGTKSRYLYTLTDSDQKLPARMDFYFFNTHLCQTIVEHGKRLLFDSVFGQKLLSHNKKHNLIVQSIQKTNLSSCIK